MSWQKKLAADLLFAVQIICVFVFGIGQTIRLLHTSEGVSITWYLSWFIFLVLNLVLAFHAHKNKASRVTIQTLWSYVGWTLVVFSNLGAMFYKNNWMWNGRDSATTIAVVLGCIGIFITAHQKRLPVTDPMVKGWLAVFFKGVPQLILAINIYMVGIGGLAGTTIIAGHISVISRLGQLWFSIKEAGWDRNRKGSALSEFANESCWIVATAVWLYIWHYQT